MKHKQNYRSIIQKINSDQNIRFINYIKRINENNNLEQAIRTNKERNFACLYKFRFLSD